MRNLKKILALVLALMMVLSVMVFASAANYDDYSDKDQVSEEYAEAVEVLTGMDIFWGSENSFYPKSNVSRAEVATLLYRVMTTDVSGSQVGIYKDYGMFDDVLETNWFAGYVNYSANNEYVVGVGDNNYNPKGNVTGYEWITMLLRAIGYDANGEISGSDWKITAAGLAKKAGILEGFNEATLNSALTREQVAYLLFNAIQASQVYYTPALNYYIDDLPSIGVENFDLASTKLTSVDEWGRPGYYWYADVDADAAKEAGEATYATIEEAPVKTYNTAVTECDVASDAGISSRKTYDVYTNGVYEEDGQEVVATDTVNTVGAQGRLAEVYSDRIVYIDTYLAQVTDAHETKTDDKGHVITEAYSDLCVYYDGSTPDTQWDMSSTDYAVGTYILVNVNESDGEGNAVAESKYTVYDVQVAESLVGSQTTIWNRVDRHTVNGKDYYDAVKFYLDQAGTDTTNHTWYFDQYDNLIGVTDIISGNYAVLKDIRWVVGTPGHAEATLIDLAGNESTVTVDTLDGFDFGGPTWTWVDNDDEPSYRAGTAGVIAGGTAFVSDDTIHNDHYYGYAMYRVDTNMDGTVSLEGAEWTAAGVGTTIVNYVADATLRTGSSTVMDGNNIVVHINNATQFLVLNGDDSFSAYEGTNALPLFVDDTVDLFYKDVNGDAIADYVYVKDAAVAADFGSLLYVVEDDYTGPLTDGATTIYRLNVVVDGVERTVTTDNAALAEYLSDNVGKVFWAYFETDETDANYGYLTNAQLVNYATDGAIGATGYSVDYLASDNIYRVGDTLVDHYAANNNVGYRVTDSTPVVGGTLSGDLNDYGIWVVYTTVGGEKIASLVYVGTKLDQDSSPVVSGKYEDADGDDVIVSGVANSTETVYTVTLPEGETSADVRVTGTHFNAVVGDTDTGSATVWAPVFEEWKAVGSTNYGITVMAEDGYHTETFAISLAGTADDVKSDVITRIWHQSASIICAQNNDGYTTIAGAPVNTLRLSKAEWLTVETFNNSAVKVEYAIYSSTAEAEEGTSADYKELTATIDVKDLDVDDILVLKLTKKAGGNFMLDDGVTQTATLYVIYEIEA